MKEKLKEKTALVSAKQLGVMVFFPAPRKRGVHMTKISVTEKSVEHS